MSPGPSPELQLAHYRLLAEVGRGGMGVVYRALDTKLDRVVAVKLLARRPGSSPVVLERFQREARLLARVNHPHVAVIHDAGTEGENHYLVCEYLSGGTLLQRIPDDGMPVGELLAVSRQLAEGLEAVHRAGIIHRDIKPGNVLFSDTGVAKLADFGLSSASDSADLTAEGAVVGTYHYIAPEQTLGAPADVQSDLFSFGATMYHMATGHRPFEGESMVAVLHRVREVEPEPLTEVRPDLPAAFCAVVHQCLAKKPAQRPARASTVAAALGGRASSEWSTQLLTQIVPPLPSRSPSVVAGWRGRGLAALAALLMAAGLWFAAKPLQTWWTVWFSARQVAVLPIEISEGTATEAALWRGLSETLVEGLAQMQQLQGSYWIVPSSEVRAANVHTVREARRAFSVTLVLGGTVFPEGGKPELALTLSDARDLRVLGTRRVALAPEAGLRDRVLGAAIELLRLQLDAKSRALVFTGGSADAEASRAYLEAEGHLRQGSVLRAIGLLEAAVQRDPDFALARATLADAYLRQLRSASDAVWLARADQEAAKAVESNEGLLQAHLTLGMVRQAMGRQEAALQAAERVLAINPASVDGMRLKAATQEALGRPAEAEATLRKAASLRPGYWPTHAALAAFLSRRGRYEEALDPLRVVTELAPENALGFRNLGSGYYRLKRYDEAIQFLQKSIQVSPTPQAYSDLGTIYFFQSRFKEAAASYESALKVAPPNAYRYGNLGDALMKMGDANRAREVYQKAIELALPQVSINPGDGEMRSSLAVYQGKAGQAAEARASVAAAVQATPGNVNVRYKAARALALAGDPQAALAQLETALAGGYSAAEASQDPDLAAVRQLPGYSRLLQRFPAR